MKLIVILADGISADYFARYAARLPNLSRMAAEGVSITRFKPDVPAVSLPARVTMITGVAPRDHGVYGNMIYDGTQQRFRYAGPHDFEVPTLGKLAMEAGLIVANIGYGMAPAVDSQLYDPPWWLNEYIYKSRAVDTLKAADNPGWAASIDRRDETGLWSVIDKSGLATALPNPDHFRHADVRGIAAELTTNQWVAALATSAEAPDLILTEWSMTDELQHMTGFASDASHMAMSLTDLYVGDLQRRLEENPQSDYVIAVVADHGHKAIDTAIYPEEFLPPGTPFAAEGMQLLVYGGGEGVIEEATAAFRSVGVRRYDDNYLPPAVRGEVVCFIAPEGFAFEDRPEGRTGPTGPAKYISNHGLTPGDPADDRMCIFWGPGIPKKEIASGASIQLMPTFCHILGVTPPSEVVPLWG